MIWLYEAIDDVKKHYPDIDDDMFMQIIAVDPTFKNNNTVGTYGKWLLNLYKKGQLSEDQFEEARTVLTQFETYKQRLSSKDIGQYKTLDAVSDAVAEVIQDTSMLSKSQRQKWMKKVKAGKVEAPAEDNYDIPFEDENWIVYIPHTHEASMKLGDGTNWCTARPSSDYYDRYTNKGNKLYIVKRKDTGDRWQFSDMSYEFRDEDDDTFGAYDFRHDYEDDNGDLIDYLDSVGFDEADEYGEGGEETEETYQDGLWQVWHYENNGSFIYRLLGVADNVYPDDFAGTDVLIPDDITEIGTAAFSNFPDCNIVIPNSVDSIHSHAFKNSDISVIKIPRTVVGVEDGLFVDCANLKTVIFSPLNMAIPSITFLRCRSLTSAIFPDGVRSVGSRSFCECDSLKLVSLGTEVNLLQRGSFMECSSLKVVHMGCDNAKIGVGGDVFYDCLSLSDIHITGTIIAIKGLISPTMKQPITIYVDSESRDAIIDYVKRTRKSNVSVADEETYDIIYRYQGE